MTRTLPTRFLPLALAALLPLSATAQEEQLQWIFNRYVAENPLDTYLGLVYGIPETDAIRASIHCAIGANWIYAAVDLGADVEGLADEASATVALNAGGREFVEAYVEFVHYVERLHLDATGEAIHHGELEGTGAEGHHRY